MSKISTAIIDFLRGFFGGGGGEGPSNVDVKYKNGSLTNQNIYDEMLKLFESKLTEMSVGERMIYPMTFNIILHEDDYQYLRGSLPLVFKEIIKKFGDIIRKYTPKYPDNQNPARQWTFQVAGCSNDIPLGDGEFLEVSKGSINVMEVGLFYEDAAANNNEAPKNVRVTVKPRNSMVYKNLNLNMDVYKNIFPISEGVMQYPFDKSVLQTADTAKTNNVSSNASGTNETSMGGRQTMFTGNENASLSYTKDGNKYTYMIKSNLVHISGENDVRTDESIFHLKSKKVKDSHVQIRFNPNEKRYQIIAYGPVCLNEKIMEESSGSKEGWIPLPNKSNILINGEICVKFLIG